MTGIPAADAVSMIDSWNDSATATSLNVQTTVGTESALGCDGARHRRDLFQWPDKAERFPTWLLLACGILTLKRSKAKAPSRPAVSASSAAICPTIRC